MNMIFESFPVYYKIQAVTLTSGTTFILKSEASMEKY